MDKDKQLSEAFDRLDERIALLEQQVANAPEDIRQVLPEGAEIVRNLLTAYAHHEGKPTPESDDLLAIFRAFVKGEPSLNTVRDNVRELVYYQNCLADGREDALPLVAARMVARTCRHIYLYLRSRSEQSGWLAGM